MFPRASAFTAPCTVRKSMGSRVRFDRRWMAMPSPYVSMAPTMVTMQNGIRSHQKSAPKPRSSPGQPTSGSPTQAASTTAVRSKVPPA